MTEDRKVKWLKARKRQESKSDPPNYYRCEEMVAGTNMICGSYCFNTYLVFIVRPDGKMVPEERVEFVQIQDVKKSFLSIMTMLHIRFIKKGGGKK